MCLFTGATVKYYETKRKLFLQWLPENSKKAAQTKKDSKLRSGRKRVSLLLVQYDFWTKLPEESWQSHIAWVVATLVFKAVEIICYPWTLSNFNFLLSFLVHSWKWPRDRKRIGLKNLAMTMLVMGRTVLMANGLYESLLGGLKKQTAYHKTLL